jgi:hypothetical protein
MGAAERPREKGDEVIRPLWRSVPSMACAGGGPGGAGKPKRLSRQEPEEWTRMSRDCTDAPPSVLTRGRSGE